MPRSTRTLWYQNVYRQTHCVGVKWGRRSLLHNRIVTIYLNCSSLCAFVMLTGNFNIHIKLISTKYPWNVSFPEWIIRAECKFKNWARLFTCISIANESRKKIIRKNVALSTELQRARTVIRLFFVFNIWIFVTKYISFI